jgi:signal transduction histidine kinase
MSCNKGIFSVAKQQLADFIAGKTTRISCRVFDEDDGMPARECNGSHLAGWRTADGQLWFPTIKGVVAIAPGQIQLNRYLPPVWLERVKLEEQWLDSPTQVVVPSGTQKLEFHYTGLSLQAPKKVRFRYQLSGFDKNWVEAETRRVAYYTNVPPGDYQFKVVACNNDGLWNEQGIAIPVTIRPYFYQTPWFRILVSLGVILLIWGCYGFRLRQVKQHEQELAKEVQKRTSELVQATQTLERTNSELRETMRQKEEVISMVAHDFRSPLTVIQGLSGQLKELVVQPDAKRMLELIYERAKYLTSLAANTLQMSSLESGLLPMNFRHDNLSDLVRSLVFLQVGQTTQEIILQAPPDDIHLLFDYDRITDVVNNLIHNALKYSPQGGAIEVSLQPKEQEVLVSVRDHGIGIPAPDLPKLFQKFVRLKSAREKQIRGTGLGLYISRVIVEAHHGKIWAESEPGQGTTFSFVLPLDGQTEGQIH